jgi:hypothetical protein
MPSVTFLPEPELKRIIGQDPDVEEDEDEWEPEESFLNQGLSVKDVERRILKTEEEIRERMGDDKRSGRTM